MSAGQWPDEELLALSGVQHFAFCPRQWALIHVERQWEDNDRTVSGDFVHGRCHDAAIKERRGDLLVVRGLYVVSRKLGLAGVCDIVEFHASGDGAALVGEDGRFQPVPVEYKRGGKKEGNEDRVQVCAQAMALEEMFFCDIPFGYLYYDAEKRREKITFDGGIRIEVESLVAEMRKCFSSGYTPRAKRRRACSNCSLIDRCEPRLGATMSVESYIRRLLGDEPQ